MKTSLTLDTLVAQAPEDVLKEQGEQAYAALGYLRREPSALFNKNRYIALSDDCLLYTSPSPRDLSTSRMPSSA